MLLRLLSSGWERLRGWVRERGAPFVLAVIAEVLIALLLLNLVPALVTEKKPIPTVFGFDMEGEEAVEPKQQQSENSRPKAGGGAKSPVRQPQPVASPTPEPPPPVTPHPDVIWLNRRDYAASDIRRSAPQPGAADAPAEVAAGNGAGRYDDSEVVGRGPNGEPLYAAEWYREPTQAELAGYRPRDARDGSGLIACRMIEHYRVEDCQEIGETPRGSGYARAVRLAAWQFRVRPPRKGGKALIGSWVRIRIDYITRRETAPTER